MNEKNRQLSLTIGAAFILRHIMFSFNLPLETVIALWGCFYVLIMRRPIPKDYFSSATAIWANIHRLDYIDKKLATDKFKKFIVKPTSKGFRRSFYMSSDDSEHHNRDRHVLIVSENGNNDDAVVDPSCRHLTSSVTISKDHDGNSDKNVKSIIDTLGVETAAYFGGGTNDNAESAQKEIESTHRKIMDKLGESNDEGVRNLRFINGVERWAIKFGDLFHIDNLIVTHASLKSWGQVIKEDHEQVHHRQVMQSIHSLHSDDRPFSQAQMDEVMEGAGESVHVKTDKERQQRWLVNQRNAKRILGLLEILSSTGIPCLVAWGMSFANWSRSAWKRRVGGEVATWLSMPEIILGLHFEAELGEYYETTYYWHNRPGPLNTRSGFRMTEVHDLYFRFMLPWWNDAVKTPESKLPKTIKYLDDNFHGTDNNKRKEQILRGLKGGRDELIKMSHVLLEGAVSFLILCDREHGPPFLRALLSVLSRQAVPDGIEVPAIKNPDSEQWGRYVYDDPNQRPENEKKWYGMLMKSPEETVHWWYQLCLNWDVLEDDLQRLSKEQGIRDAMNGAPILAFKSMYPILFECLHATFGMMMSNSRLCEQIHGMMRHGLRDGTGMDEADAQRSYATSTDYNMKEERRRMSLRTNGNGKKMKPEVHCHTKDQQQLLSQQIACRAPQYEQQAETLIRSGSVPPIKAIVTSGRRQQDKQHITDKVQKEKQKRQNLTREMKTYEDFKTRAKETTLANDLMMMQGDNDIDRRSKLKEMSVQAFWNSMKDPVEYRDMFAIAVKAFPCLCNMVPRPDKALTSRAAIMKFAIKPYLERSMKTSKTIYAMLYGEKGSDNEVPRRERALHLMDIFNMFVRLVPSAWERVTIQPVTLALISSFQQMDPHYVADYNTNDEIQDVGAEEHSSSDESNLLGEDSEVEDNFDT